MAVHYNPSCLAPCPPEMGSCTWLVGDTFDSMTQAVDWLRATCGVVNGQSSISIWADQQCLNCVYNADLDSMCASGYSSGTDWELCNAGQEWTANTGPVVTDFLASGQLGVDPTPAWFIFVAMLVAIAALGFQGGQTR